MADWYAHDVPSDHANHAPGLHDGVLRPQVALTVEAAVAALEGATRAIAGELDLDRVLQMIVDGVRDLVQARYAALGIVDDGGRIERFITSGMTAAERLSIGPTPRGRGLLGLIIREAHAFRVANIAAHPATSGFPPNHPPMTSFLGVPVETGGEPIGNFYLTDKIGAAEFSEQDQRLVEMFALHAEVAIQNARLHTRVQRLAVLDERLRIGRDLHDGIIQGLYAIALSLEDVPDIMAVNSEEAVARIDRAIDRLNTSIGEIRGFIMDLGSDANDAALSARLAALTDELLLTSGGRLLLDHELAEADVAGEGLSFDAVSQLLLDHT